MGTKYRILYTAVEDGERFCNEISLVFSIIKAISTNPSIIIMLLAITCVLAALAIASGAIEADKVTKLPGFVGDLPSTHYSGCKIYARYCI